ncbi:hypothetical protein DFH07DRAFT_69201 [Mycena maculata]|uniref:Uncharacterized protein n=1 Tax=Mycena maculata TaxID=230809 RepID=A0AAD7IEW5_9AGAR|nr:hypothetical protein DFH07DRAFT_69201 [Mycena maculata]
MAIFQHASLLWPSIGTGMEAQRCTLQSKLVRRISCESTQSMIRNEICANISVIWRSVHQQHASDASALAAQEASQAFISCPAISSPPSWSLEIAVSSWDFSETWIRPHTHSPPVLRTSPGRLGDPSDNDPRPRNDSRNTRAQVKWLLCIFCPTGPHRRGEAKTPSCAALPGSSLAYCTCQLKDWIEGQSGNLLVPVPILI